MLFCKADIYCPIEWAFERPNTLSDLSKLGLGWPRQRGYIPRLSFKPLLLCCCGIVALQLQYYNVQHRQ